jgi:hypothetical protein
VRHAFAGDDLEGAADRIEAAGLMIAFAGVVALVAMGYAVLSGQQRLAEIRMRDYL